VNGVHPRPGKTPPWDPEPTWGDHGVLLRLELDGTELARYVDGTGSPGFDSPRPHLHPVRTRAGVTVTDAAPPDHTWHVGAGIGVQDVDGSNIWGGRTYLPDQGYTWRPDHGRMTHREWLRRTPASVSHRLDWTDADGAVQVEEIRDLAWAQVDEDAWRLDLGFALRPGAGRSVVRLGSPGSNGRQAAGYGGLFWRVASCREIDVRTPLGRGEHAVHGTRPADGARWLAWSAVTTNPVTGASGEFTLVVIPRDADTARDPWFVRVADYPGIGSALAWDAALAVREAAPVRRAFTWVIADGRWSDDRVAAAVRDATDDLSGGPTDD